MDSKPNFFTILKRNGIDIRASPRRDKINDPKYCISYSYIRSELKFYMTKSEPLGLTGLINTKESNEWLSSPITPGEFVNLRGFRSSLTGFAPEEIIFMLQDIPFIKILNEYDDLWNINVSLQGKDFMVSPIYIPKQNGHDAHFVTAIISGDTQNRRVQILDTSRPGNGINYKEELKFEEKNFDFISNDLCDQGREPTCGFFTMSACRIAALYSNFDSLNGECKNGEFQKKVKEDVDKTFEKVREFKENGLSSSHDVSQKHLIAEKKEAGSAKKEIQVPNSFANSLSILKTCSSPENEQSPAIMTNPKELPDIVEVVEKDTQII